MTAFANCEDVNDVVTPDIKHSAQGSKLLFIDLNAADFPLGGSALAQVFSQVGEKTPEVDLELLQRAIRAVQTLIKQGHVLAGHDRSDGGLLTTVLEMAFAGNCGLDLSLPADVPAIPYLFNEGLGLVLEVDEGLCAPLMRSLADNQIPAVILGATRSEHRVTVVVLSAPYVQIRQGETVLLDESLLSLRQAWEQTSFELEKLAYNREFVEKVRVTSCDDAQDYNARMQMTTPHWQLTYTPLSTRSALLSCGNKYRVAVLREEVGVFPLLLRREPTATRKWWRRSTRRAWSRGR